MVPLSRVIWSLSNSGQLPEALRTELAECLSGILAGARPVDTLQRFAWRFDLFAFEGFNFFSHFGHLSLQVQLHSSLHSVPSSGHL